MTTQDTQPALTVNDLVLACNIIQSVATRGAFKADEFTIVGGCYDRLLAYLKSVGAVAPAPTAATTDASAESTEA